jgi:hypothetical protein
VGSATSDAMLIDPAQYALGLRSEMRFDTSIQAHFAMCTAFVPESAPVPEPSTVPLLDAALAGFTSYARKRRKK